MSEEYLEYFMSQWASHRQLLQLGHYTDLSLLCTDGSISLHSPVLAPRSSLLSSLLPSTMEDQVMISLPGVKSVTIRCLVDILYSGSCRINTSLELQSLRDVLEMLGLSDTLGSIVLHIGRDSGEGQETEQENEANRDVLESTLSPARERRKVKKRNCCTSPNRDSLKKLSRSPCVVSCCICGQVFRSRYWLRVHLTVHHFYTEVARLVSEPGSPCDLCTATFTGPRAAYTAVVHRGAGHRAVELFLKERQMELRSQRSCRICGEECRPGPGDLVTQETSQTLVTHHLTTRHYLRRIMDSLQDGQRRCHLCNKKYINAQVLARHLGIKHGMSLMFYNQEVEAGCGHGTETREMEYQWEECSDENTEGGDIKEHLQERKDKAVDGRNVVQGDRATKGREGNGEICNGGIDELVGKCDNVFEKEMCKNKMDNITGVQGIVATSIEQKSVIGEIIDKFIALSNQEEQEWLSSPEVSYESYSSGVNMESDSNICEISDIVDEIIASAFEIDIPERDYEDDSKNGAKKLGKETFDAVIC